MNANDSTDAEELTRHARTIAGEYPDGPAPDAALAAYFAAAAGAARNLESDPVTVIAEVTRARLAFEGHQALADDTGRWQAFVTGMREKYSPAALLDMARRDTRALARDVGEALNDEQAGADFRAGRRPSPNPKAGESRETAETAPEWRARAELAAVDRCEDCGTPMSQHGGECGIPDDPYARPAGWRNATTGEFWSAPEPGQDLVLPPVQRAR